MWTWCGAADLPEQVCPASGTVGTCTHVHTPRHTPKETHEQAHIQAGGPMVHLWECAGVSEASPSSLSRTKTQEQPPRVQRVHTNPCTTPGSHSKRQGRESRSLTSGHTCSYSEAQADTDRYTACSNLCSLSDTGARGCDRTLR